MDLSGDELAGIVDLFGTLGRAELVEALSELAYRRGVEPPDEATIDDAIDAYRLFAYRPPDCDDRRLLAGPAAFPTLPDGAEDLPHILDVERRSVDRAAAGEAARRRIAAAAADDPDDPDRERLLDLTYDLEAWAPVDAGDLRDSLAE